jgi:hypothetical protein
MPTLDRRISPRGPRFWLDGEVVMFARQIDASTREGPRAATEADRAAWPDALADLGLQGVDPPGAPLTSARAPEPRRAKAARG